MTQTKCPAPHPERVLMVQDQHGRAVISAKNRHRMTMDAEFTVFTDFNQFTVSDQSANFEDLAQKWTDETASRAKTAT